MLELEGCSLFRHYITCSLLSKKPIRICNIHADDDPMGINVYEANFLKFIDRISSGSSLECSEYNTVLTFHPGVILGGCFTHEIPPQRCVTYIIEAALLILPFAKYNSKITFVGSTQSELDLSIDTIRTVSTRWLQLFGVDVHVRVIRRGAPPGGGGMVELSVTAVRRLKSAYATERGRVKRIRGIAFANRTALDLPHRVATTAKGILLNIIPDVYIISDVEGGNGNKNENSSGYGVVLVAETTSKLCVLSQETVAASQELPESVGLRAANLLLDQLYNGGCVDSHHEMLVLLLMSLSPDEVSTVRFGFLSSNGLSAVLLMETFFSVKCAIKEEESFAGYELPHSVLVTCLGSNLVNVWKRSS